VSRLLVVMGSGETSPTMVATHREVLATSGGPAILLDTPYGFQENAADISARAVAYFRDTVGHAVEPATLGGAGADVLRQETALAAVRAARWVFAGPGSPSYALRQWAGSPLPGLLEQLLEPGGAGGAIVFASAAALTLGVATVPVYEIYKCGAPPGWLDGLDLLGRATGLHAAVIPHYDNAEGGNHDTRFCYLGERRLAAMEAMLPGEAFVLGVDEHTAAVFDLDAATMTVAGRGVVTVRRDGESSTIASGTSVATASLATGRVARDASVEMPGPAAGPAQTGETAPAQPAPASLADRVRELSRAFDAAMAGRDVDAAVRAVLALDDEVLAWSSDTLQSDGTGRARAALRGMVLRLGELAKVGAVDRREVIGPFINELLGLRAGARADRRFAEADRVRDRLTELGVEVRDTPDGAQWVLAVAEHRP